MQEKKSNRYRPVEERSPDSVVALDAFLSLDQQGRDDFLFGLWEKNGYDEYGTFRRLVMDRFEAFQKYESLRTAVWAKDTGDSSKGLHKIELRNFEDLAVRYVCGELQPVHSAYLFKSVKESDKFCSKCLAKILAANKLL